MAEYNTRGMGHMSGRKDFDTKYNMGVAWSEAFQSLAETRLAQIDDRYFYPTKHVMAQINKNKHGNRLIGELELSLSEIKKGTVVEAEFKREMYGDEQMESLRKIVTRLPARTDGEQVVVVVQFEDSMAALIKTAWLNKATDNHQKGLDTTDIETNVDGIYGYVDSFGRDSRAVRVEDGILTELDGSAAKTTEKYLAYIDETIPKLEKEVTQLTLRGKISKVILKEKRIHELKMNKAKLETEIAAKSGKQPVQRPAKVQEGTAIAQN